jgi:hypothetical protein
MPPQNQIKMPNQKQKIMLVVTVVIIIFVAWQVYGLFGGGGGEAEAPATTANKAAAGQPAAGGTPASQAAAGAPAEIPQPKQAPVQANTELLKIQQDTQAKYVSALNELQMLKVQKEIAETKQAITSSILANATAEKSITDLLTVQQIPTQNQFSSAPSAPAAMPTGGMSSSDQPVKPMTSMFMEVPYTIVSVTFKNERWNAVLMYQEKYYHVSVGDVLPADNTTVTAINKNGVTLTNMKDRSIRKILISGTL